MAETPKTRAELIEALRSEPAWVCWSIEETLTAIESLGLRIVPAKLPHGYFDATKDAMASAYRDVGDIWENVYAAAIAASPFSPENPNG